MSKFAFVGPSYTGLSKVFDGERTVNLIPERVESGNKKSSEGPGDVFVLNGSPGTKLFATLPDKPIRGFFAGENALYVAAGPNFYQVFRDGTYLLLGSIGPQNNSPVQIFSNASDIQSQLFIVSSGMGYIADGIQILAVVAATTGGYMDGYFFAQVPYTRHFQFSAIGNGLIWDPADVATKEGASDALASILIDHEEIWLFGEKTTEVWYDSGAANLPFARIPGAFIEQGCAATWSPAKVDNSVCWLGSDERGAGVVWRATGYTPTRISNHCVETAIQSYSQISDAVGFCYQDQGHTYYMLSFPKADKTWAYDVATNMWHEREYMNPANATFHASLARYHAYAFGGAAVDGPGGMHLVGGGDNTGNIYQQSVYLYQDNGGPKRWLRSAPHISDEMKKMFHRKVQFDMQMGAPSTVPLLDGNGNIRPAQVMLRISDDGGNTWGDIKVLSVGKIGEYLTRAIARQLGGSRDRVYELSGTDPIQTAIVDAYLKVDPGTGQ